MYCMVHYENSNSNLRSPEMKPNILSDKTEPRTERGLKRQKRLLGNAVNLFLEHGYDNVSLDKIIQASGGSKSTIYKLYGNKKGLFLACLQGLVDKVYSAYESNYDEKRTWQEELRVFGRVYLTAILSDTAIGTSRLIFSQTAKDPDIGRWFYTEGAQLSYLCFAKVLENKLDLPFIELKAIALHYIELLKSDLYMHRMCDPDFLPGAEEIEEEVLLCSSIIESFILHRMKL